MSALVETEIGLIPDAWMISSVGQLVENGVLEKPLDGNHGEKHPKGEDFKQEGIPFIMATDITNGNIDLINCKFISMQLADSLDKGFSIVGDVLITHKASLGRTAIVKNIKTPYIMLTPQVTYYRIKNRKILNNIFLKYYFDSPSFQETMNNHGDSGSTRAYVGITAQRDLPILLPPLSEQRAIASVLSSLDDKIDLLHRQNKTLEAMAETLFRQWFIEEADEEWEKRPLSQTASFLNGIACQKYPPKNLIDQLPVLKIKELRNGITMDSDWASTDVEEKYHVKNGDIIFSWSASLLVKIWDGPDCILNQHLFKVTSEEFPKWFIYQWCKEHLREFISISTSHATTMGHIKREDLDNAMTLIPSIEELRIMNKKMAPIFNKIILISNQIKNLINLRDSLLVKLISGEVRLQQ